MKKLERKDIKVDESYLVEYDLYGSPEKISVLLICTQVYEENKIYDISKEAEPALNHEIIGRQCFGAFKILSISGPLEIFRTGGYCHIHIGSIFHHNMIKL